MAPQRRRDRATVIAALPPEDQPEQGPTKQLPPQFRRQLVDYPTSEPAGTIIIDTPHTFLYLVRGHGKALRYGIGVGREGFTWAGSERVTRMSEWPDWHPPKEMIERQPYLPRFMAGGDEQSAGRTRALSRQHDLSHPRHQPAIDHRLFRVLGLHPPDQPGHLGSLRPSECRYARRRAVGTSTASPAPASGPAPASASAQAPVTR